MARRVPNPRRKRARRDRNYKSVMRPTKFGNPFKIPPHSREESMELYAAWLDEKLETEPDFLEELRGYDLGCTCAPELACHVDVILSRLYGD